jgi:hypothetical protein
MNEQERASQIGVQLRMFDQLVDALKLVVSARQDEEISRARANAKAVLKQVETLQSVVNGNHRGRGRLSP